MWGYITGEESEEDEGGYTTGRQSEGEEVWYTQEYTTSRQSERKGGYTRGYTIANSQRRWREERDAG